VNFIKRPTSRFYTLPSLLMTERGEWGYGVWLPPHAMSPHTLGLMQRRLALGFPAVFCCPGY